MNHCNHKYIIYELQYTCIQKVKYGAQSVYDTLLRFHSIQQVPTMNWVFTSICHVGSKEPNASIKEATTKSISMCQWIISSFTTVYKNIET